MTADPDHHTQRQVRPGQGANRPKSHAPLTSGDTTQVPHCFGQRGIRCPVLQPDPTQADRLDAIITSLGERIEEARERGWNGEVEGLEVSLAAARDKRQRMVRITSLGIPSTRRDPNGV
jgi:hypothetical protein